MPGPLPKDRAIRQRRNKTASAATLPAEEAAAPKRRVPGLPKLADVVEQVVERTVERDGQPVTERVSAPVQVAHEWHPLTRAWWRDVWRSPMAAEYLQADVHGLYRLAMLVDQFWHAPDAKLAGEIRLQQQCFGLTPIDRRRLQWEVERVEEATSRKRRQPVAQPAGEPIDDPRSVLKIVGGKG